MSKRGTMAVAPCHLKETMFHHWCIFDAFGALNLACAEKHGLRTNWEFSFYESCFDKDFSAQMPRYQMQVRKVELGVIRKFALLFLESSSGASAGRIPDKSLNISNVFVNWSRGFWAVSLCDKRSRVLMSEPENASARFRNLDSDAVIKLSLGS